MIKNKTKTINKLSYFNLNFDIYLQKFIKIKINF